MKYQPTSKILDNYANVLVNFALNSGRGIKKDEVVFLQVPESAKPLLLSLYQAVLKSGGHPIIQYLPDEMEHLFFQHASEQHLNFFPAKFLKGKINQADHFISIIAETNKHELEGIDPQKIMQKNISLKPYMDWRNEKENKGKFTWTLGMYPTKAMATEAKMTLKQCWQQVIKACYLDEQNPIKKWQETSDEVERIKKVLNKLPITNLNIKANKTDLNIGVDKNRQWLGGGGRNIPSFEVFISPDWRRTNGHIFFDLPLYRYGNEIRDISLIFDNGIVTQSSASKGESVLKKMIDTKNANKIGEFSLTDKRLSKINKFMAETLFDENFGGKYGNTHLALGMAYQESYPKKLATVTPKQWAEMGYNDSVIHTDIIATTDRVVTATLDDGSKLVIYQSGIFVI